MAPVLRCRDALSGSQDHLGFHGPQEMNPRLPRLISAVGPFLAMVGTAMGIPATFEAVARGTVADAGRVGFRYGPLAGLAGMLIGLVDALLYRPGRSQ
jgi:hypothetical protein